MSVCVFVCLFFYIAFLVQFCCCYTILLVICYHIIGEIKIDIVDWGSTTKV
jgi:hypothetical protein